MIDLWLKTISPGLDAYNATVNLLANFVGFKTDLTMEEVIQTVGSKWQKNTEVTKGVGSAKIQGYWIRTASSEYKTYMGWTRKFIRENSSAHVVQHFAAQIKGLNEQKYTEIMTALFGNVERDVLDLRTHEALKIPTLVNGTGNMPIPSVGMTTFTAGTHNHFSFVDTSSANWTVVATREAQLKALVRLVREHGYYQNLVIMVNSAMTDAIMQCPSFRAFVGGSPFGQSDGSVLYGQDVQATMQTFAPLGGLFRVVGTLPFATVLESDILPNNYVASFSYNGPNSPENPVQWMDTPVTSFSESPFPFYETLFETAFGASIRKRLNGAILYAAPAAASYVIPTSFGTVAGAVGDWDGQ